MVQMSEPADRPLTPLSTPEQLLNRDSRGSRSEVENGGERRDRRRGRLPADLQLCVDTESDPSESRRKPASLRVKPVEQLSPMLSTSDIETKFERKKQPSQLSKTNTHYHKLFKDVSKDELLKQSYTCALQKDMLYQGKMFVSDNWICFHSKVFGRDTKISIPVMSVTFIKKTKTALLVPNALVIETTSDQHVFVSFLSRNTTYKLLKSICVHPEVEKTCNSPILSSCENSFRVSCSSSLPLDFSGDFSDLDGVVQQRRQEMMESSSSDSQTPDYDKITDFSGLPDSFLSAVKSGEVSVHADIHLQTPGQKHRAALNNGSAKPTRVVTLKEKSTQPKSLQAILLIYLVLVSVLVLSSCYMAFKIVALEHRLNSLVSIGEHIRNENAVSHRSQDEVNAEVYGELSTNLFRLEKVCLILINCPRMSLIFYDQKILQLYFVDFQKCDCTIESNLARIPSANMEEAGFMIYTAASHQVANKLLWLHYWEAVMSSIFIDSNHRPASVDQDADSLATRKKEQEAGDNGCAGCQQRYRVPRVKRHHGRTGTVPSFVHGEQQARVPQEDPGQQAGGQAPVQLLPQHTPSTVSGPVWTPLLFLLLQQDSQYMLLFYCSNGPQKCSACIKEDIFEDPTSILKQGCAFPDNAVRREVENLSAVCINENCTWKGSIKEYELNHEGKCEFMIIPCPSCKERIRFNEQERHNERECPERTLNCKYCKEPFHFKNIKAHDEICPKYPMICEGCAKKKIPREKYVDHIKFCSKFRTPCRFHVVGCDISVEKEKIHDHERAYAYEHLNLLLHYIMGMKVSMEGLQPQGLEVAGHKLVELQQSLRELEARVSQLITTSSGPPVQGAAASSSSSSSGPPGPPASAPLPPPPTLAPTLSVSTSFTPLPSSVGAALELQLHSEKTKVAELGRRCTELEVKSGTFENVVCVLNREVERFATTMEASNRQHKLDQDKIEALSNKVRQLERTVGLKDLTVAEMEGRLREMSATTFDGVFVWRISDFAKKRQDAIAGRAPAMFSPAFYTNKYGYKMCLRIYLNGDGTGRGSHLSLFFVVMRGLSDALLKWPFNQKVTLMLLDQSNREHIIDAFRPDVTSSSFQRPVSEMNIASGCPLFCPLSKLDAKNSYIRDDTIFIKAIVDLTGL
ncbi:uncharacterized protein gramd2b [Paralichthys olivaceus]|uniref:uncharacterized protein gramd2b n=1 Tax=Paralichthys olivaceus TaxID=8255 RepID=UPI003752FF68